jgi:photosystem II stability/assembly factor-like uncharacterized protein
MAAIVVFALILSSAEIAGAKDACKFESSGPWSRIPLPALGLSNASFGDFPRIGMNPQDPKQIFVAGEQTIVKSSDGGCTWSEAFSLESLVAPSGDIPTRSFGQLVVGAKEGQAHIYALTRSARSLLLGQPDPWRLAVSTDGGNSWVEKPLNAGDPKREITGYIERIWVAPSDPSQLYLLHSAHQFTTDGNPPPPSTLYASEDAGESWESRSVYASTAAAGNGLFAMTDTEGQCVVEPVPCMGVPFERMEIDPLAPDTLWSATRFGIYRSTTGGQSWAKVSSIGFEDVGPVHALDVFHRVGEPARITVIGQWGMVWSHDEGNSWADLSLPKIDNQDVMLYRVAHGRTPKDFVVAAGFSNNVSMFRLDVRVSGGAWVNITHPQFAGNSNEGAQQLRFVVASSAPRASYFYSIVGDGSALMRFASR